RLAGSHAHAAHPGPVVVPGPRGAGSAPQRPGRACLVEQPRDVHGAPGRTIHPVPVRDGVGVVAVGLGVPTNAGSRQPNYVTGLALPDRSEPALTITGEEVKEGFDFLLH